MSGPGYTAEEVRELLTELGGCVIKAHPYGNDPVKIAAAEEQKWQELAHETLYGHGLYKWDYQPSPSIPGSKRKPNVAKTRLRMQKQSRKLSRGKR